MARKGGNPDLAKYRFTSETARKASLKAAKVRNERHSTFRSVRAIVERTAPDTIVTAKIEDFWEKHNVPRVKITPLMAELTPIYAKAVSTGDILVLERIYKILGITFDSTREHNTNDSVGEEQEKSFEINYIVDGTKQEPLQIECEQVE